MVKNTPANIKNGKFDPIIRRFPDSAPARKKMNTTADSSTTPKIFTQRLGFRTIAAYNSISKPTMADKMTGWKAVFQENPCTKINS